MNNFQKNCGHLLFLLLGLLFFHQSGYSQSPVSYTVDQSTTGYSLKKAFGLPNGRSGVITLTTAGRFICTIVNIDGTIANSYDITSQMSPQVTSTRLEVKATGTPGGNIFIIYTSDEIPNTNQNALYLVLNQSGATVASGIVNATNEGPLTGLNRYFDLAVLSNGNVVATWEIYQENADHTSTTASGSGMFRIFTEAGVAVTSDIVFAGPSSAIFTSVINSPGDGVRVAANSSTGFLISFYYYGGNFRAIRFDNSGTAQTTSGAKAFVVDATVSTGTYHNYKVLGLANGNYMLCWRRSQIGYYNVINGSGVDVKANTSLTDPDIAQEVSTNGWLGIAAVNTTGKQGFDIAIIHYQDYNDLSNPNVTVRVYNYDLSGNYVSPTTDITPYFIADPSPKTDLYSGLPTGVGVAYQSYKTFTPTSYGYDVPADADVRGVNLGFTAVSQITDYFRTKASGNWNDVNTWQSSSDNSTWISATLTPDFNANTISILNTHSVSITTNLTIDQVVVNSGGAVIVNPGIVLTINNGTGTDITVNSGGSFTLKSTAAGTALIGNSSGTTSGTFTVERFVPARRAWRLMTAPLSNANTIRQAWQNNGINTPGVGTFITGPVGTGLDNGTNYSLKTYDTLTQQLLPVSNTTLSLSSANPNAANKGYFLFVRGDRNAVNLTPPNNNVTTLSSSGNLQTGAQSFTTSSVPGNFTLVGNPYASPVDFNLVTRNNLVKRFYAWDPTLNTVGGYVLLDDVNNTGTYSTSVASSQTNILQSSQAFFVQTNSIGSSSILFNESSKSIVSNNAGFRTGNGVDEVLRTSLYVKNADTAILADGVLSEFNNSYSAKVNIEDGPKFDNINENLALLRDGQSLAIERRPLADVKDTLNLQLTNTTSRNYQFRFEPSNFSAVASAWLEDTYLNTQSPISVTDPTNIDFSIDLNTGSANTNRFRILFKTNTTLALNATTVKAYTQNAGIQIEWNVAKGTGISRYEVEKSEDGMEFKKIGTVAATTNDNASVNYTLFDKDTYIGNNFYRVKTITKSGEERYSVVIVLKVGNGKANIIVYPNPVIEKSINLQFNNQPAGTYIVQLINSLGQQMFTKTIDHRGGSSFQVIKLSPVVSKGMYQLRVSNGENVSNQQLIIQ